MKTEAPPKPAPAEKKAGRAGTPYRAHAINLIALELNAAGEVHSYDDGAWAIVFAIHNLFRGMDHPARAVPISVRFGGNTTAYALAAIRKGTHFTVTGRLDYGNEEDGKEWYRINAQQLRVHSLKDRPASLDAA
jgi:hypothetical protein